MFSSVISVSYFFVNEEVVEAFFLPVDELFASGVFLFLLLEVEALAWDDDSADFRLCMIKKRISE